MKMAIIQHSPWEGPGRYLQQAALKCDVTFQIINAWEGLFPDPACFKGFILLGGSANVHEEDQYPFLKKEKEYIEELVKINKPCLGICLGHQLLAHALGARVGSNFCTSIGLGEAHITPEGQKHKIFKVLPRTIPTFKWHGQAVLTPVPNHFEILATSKQCQVEAFSIKERPHLIGMQFDNHAAHPDDVAAWYDQDKDWLDSIESFNFSRQELIETIGGQSARMARQFEQLFALFCNLL